MVDAIGLYAGIKPIKGAKEFSYFDYSPSVNMFEGIKNNNIRNPTPGLYTPVGKLPSEFNETIFRSTLKQVLPVKGQPDAVIYGRPESEKNGFMYSHQGYARKQQKGLAYDANKPIDLPVMPIAGFFNADLVNTFGNLK
tara:strand:+ start:30 stop:446 length:417 start_codon:yes stop_codon:yes gene_type:complete